MHNTLAHCWKNNLFQYTKTFPIPVHQLSTMDKLIESLEKNTPFFVERSRLLKYAQHLQLPTTSIDFYQITLF